MQFISCANESQLASQAAGLIAASISAKSDFVLCAASGNSPTLTYKEIVRQRNSFGNTNLTLVKLDEWGGIPMNHPASCETYLQELLVRPLGLTPSQFISFRSETPEPEAEANRIQKKLKEIGKMNLVVLGLGVNGHIAFNEPAEALNANCHVARLSESSMNHPMALQMANAGRYGLTLGMANILQAEVIVLIVMGKSKSGVFDKLKSGLISTYLPASLLWLHPRVHCFYTQDLET